MDDCNIFIRSPNLIEICSFVSDINKFKVLKIQLKLVLIISLN